jgi:NAD(P)-dependent dehydrogenase (short-subunit alcohol dehydrogenase family)
MAETHHKAVLITGAGKRIGRALAEALATDGWAIAAHYAGSKSKAEALITEITDKGGKACGAASRFARCRCRSDSGG